MDNINRNQLVEDELYDINRYSDEELFNILNLTNPTDRELEAKIISLYKRYHNIQNKSGDQLASFFRDVYERFFDIQRETGTETGTGTGTETGTETETETGTGTETGTNRNTVKNDTDYTTIEGFDDTPVPTSSTGNNAPTSSVVKTSTILYEVGNINPTLKETIKRIVTVDSALREDKTSMSTDYSANLSETLKDVVCIKLYDISIPLTWYTVSKNYGCNFFYLKGNSPGINTGEFDYKIEILAGNYTAVTLVGAINDSLNTVKNTIKDVTFTDTQFEYNESTMIATFNINLNKQYNETSYYLYFPTWNTPNSVISADRFNSIPSFLGYNYNRYYTNVLFGLPRLVLTTNTTEQQNDITVGKYYITDANKSVTIIRYIGPNEYSAGNSVVDLSINLSLSALGLNQVVTRYQIIEELRTQIENSLYLIDSSITRRDIIDPLKYGYGNSLYELQIKFNRITTNNIDNTKTIVIFPDESNIPNTFNKIWTGQGSCFEFENLRNEINNITTETSTVQQQSGRYVITTNPSIILKCNKLGYSVDANSYTIRLSNSTSTGYSLNEYITAINDAITVTNNTAKNANNPVGDFNMKNQKAYIGTGNKFNVAFDINRTFTQDMYYLDLSNSILKSIFNLSGDYLTGIPSLTNSFLLDKYSNKYNYATKVGKTYTFISENTEMAYTFTDNFNILSNNTSTYSNNSYDTQNMEVYNYLTLVNTPDLSYTFTITNPLDINTSKVTDNNGLIYNYQSIDNSKEYTTSYIFKNNDTDQEYVYADAYQNIEFYLNNFRFPFINTTDPNDILYLANLSGVSYQYNDISYNKYTFKSSFVENTQYFIDNKHLLVALPSTRQNKGNQNAGPFEIFTQNSLRTLRPVYTSYQTLQDDINYLFDNYTDSFNTPVFYGTKIEIVPNITTRQLECTFTISIRKTITQLDYSVGFYDSNYTVDNSNNKLNSTWSKHLHIDDSSLLLVSTTTESGKPLLSYYNPILNISYTTVTGDIPISVNRISFIDNVNNFFYLKPYEKGVVSSKNENDIKFIIPAFGNDGITTINYTRDDLIKAINKSITSNPITEGSSIKLITRNYIEYSVLRLNVNKKYTAVDYNLIFYDQISFSSCFSSNKKSITNTTWDTTLGWTLGFQENTIYSIADYGNAGETIRINGKSAVNVDLYTKFILCLDDYAQNHLNDGVVTVAANSDILSMPSYAQKTNFTCDPTTGLLSYDITNSNSQNRNNLTQKQIYSMTAINNSKRESSIISSSSNVNSKSYGSGPFVKNAFAIIGFKGGQNGRPIVWDGGTLQAQNRMYFGPVNISKFYINLVSNRGDTVDLNSSDWSFSLEVEQLYQQSK